MPRNKWAAKVLCIVCGLVIFMVGYVLGNIDAKDNRQILSNPPEGAYKIAVNETAQEDDYGVIIKTNKENITQDEETMELHINVE